MREVLTAFIVPQFCALIADDTGLIFKQKINGEWRPVAMIKYNNIDFAEFHGSNLIITKMNGAEYKAAVLQKKRLMEIFEEKDIFCVDHGFLPF